MITVAESRDTQELSHQSIKQVLVTALERKEGVTVSVVKIGKRDLGYVQPSKVEGDIVTVKVTDEFIGFAVHKNNIITTYKTVDINSREMFLVWLHKANACAVAKKDYNMGPGETVSFQRSI